jgi:hypothetical protein
METELEKPKKLQRYLIRKSTGDVFAWNEPLSQRKDLEEVFALNPKEALTKNALPDPRNVSLHQIEAMTKPEIQLFASARLGLKLDMAKKLPELQDEVKMAIFQPRVEDEGTMTIPNPLQLDRPKARVI